MYVLICSALVYTFLIDLASYQGTLGRVRRYLEGKEGKKEDVTTFWVKESNGLWALIPLVQKLLSIPATSAAAERSFSSTSFLQQGRTQLEPANLEKLAVVRNFIAQPQFNEKDFIDSLIEAHQTHRPVLE